MHYYILPYFICGPSLAAHRQCTFVLHRDWTRSENQERYQRKVATPSFEAHYCTTQWFFESKTTACVFLLLQFDDFFLSSSTFFIDFDQEVVFESSGNNLLIFEKKICQIKVLKKMSHPKPSFWNVIAVQDDWTQPVL